MKITKLEIILLILLIIPFIILEFHSSNFFVTHDGRYHLERTFYFLDSLKEGTIFPSWSRYYNNGFGSPIFIFLFPLPYIVSSFFLLISDNLVVSVKLTFIFFITVAAFFTYLWLKIGLRTKKTASYIGTVLYLYSPYMLSQTFVRGSLRELAGAALFPLVLLSFSSKKIRVISLILSLFFLTDGVSVYIFLPTLCLYLTYLFIKNENRAHFILKIISSTILAFLISAFVLFPYIFERQYLTWGNATNYRDHFVYFWQLIDPHWGFGFSMPGPIDGMPFQIGIANILTVIVSFFYLIRHRSRQNLLTILFLGNISISILLLLVFPPTQFIWELIKPLQSIQLPWRLLAPISLSIAFIGSWLADKKITSLKITFIIILLIILLDFKYLRTNQQVIYEPKGLVQNSLDATAFHEFIPVFRQTTSQFDNFPNKIEAPITNLTENNNALSFDISLDTPQKIRINTLYFPGWKAYIDGHLAPISITINLNKPITEKRDLSGLIEVYIPKGKHHILLKFEDTTIRKIGKILSIIGLIISLSLIAKPILNNRIQRLKSVTKST